MKIDTSEVRALAAALDREGGRVGKEAAGVIRKGGRAVESAAKRMAPVASGELRNDISSRITGDGRSGGVAAIIETDVRQGFFQERGTSRHPAQPFMQPALDGVAPGVISALERIMGEALS